jgi:hypothetical protein
MASITKQIYRLKAIPTKVTLTFFIEIEISIPKFIQKHKTPRIGKKRAMLEVSLHLTSNYTTKPQRKK